MTKNSKNILKWSLIDRVLMLMPNLMKSIREFSKTIRSFRLRVTSILRNSTTSYLWSLRLSQTLEKALKL